MRVAGPVAIVLLSVIGLASPSLGQGDGQTIGGQLRVEDDTGERVPVEGVLVTIDGQGEAVSDAEGRWSIAVSEPGTYTVVLDATTLPDAVSLRDSERGALDMLVEAGQSKTALFALTTGDVGAPADEGEGITGRRVAQLTVEGLKQGLYLAMAAIGLSLIFGTTGLVNFAHAELVTWGGLTTFFFNYYGLAGVLGFLAPLPGPFGDGVNLIFAAVFGMISGGLLGYALDRFLFRGMRRDGVSLIAQMVITIGLSILMRYFFLYNFGGNPRFFQDFASQRAMSIGPVEITPKDLAAMAVSIAILLLVGALLQLTRIGKAMRAVADNRDLAESSGIDVERIIGMVWTAGAALAALGGVFFGLDQVRWDFGFRILLLIFAAVVLGGLGTAYGALVGAIVVGLAINLSTLFIDAELKNMVALLVLVTILLVRPQGILGRPERVG
ncbi:MAG: branched-chain amino acid ABC transporter permease [Acidimicrobiia bacterium]|nr:branched-chain amino acid ABC transporter permease [Acidimicrobiia bacterium]